MAGEQSFKAVINDTKPSAKGRSFSVEITGSNFNHFLGKKIGDSVEGMFVGEGDQTLNGYKLQITGGSDKTGRPMRSELEGGNVKSVLINIFGGIIHCDMIANGIIEAVKELNFKLPIVVRFQGTNSKEGRDIINKSNLGMTSIDDFTEAAKKVVELAKE